MTRIRTIEAADLFAGAGMASQGLTDACQELGLPLRLRAINHWPVAVATHQANHPSAEHYCESVEDVNPRKAVPGGRLDLLLAGPECTHHSTARGGKPVNDQSRASAWCILRWATALQVDTILIENVREFLSWGPLGANGRPLKSRKGETFRAFVGGLEALGYRVAWKVLNAADYGDPTTRERLFIQARRGRAPIVWPQPSHAAAPTETLYDGAPRRWRTAREIIDWSIPGQSIFARKRPLSPNTLARIAAGLRKFGGQAAEPFLVLLNGGGCKGAGGARSLDEPAPTITAGGEHLGLCQPFVLPQQSGGAPRSTDCPLPTVATDGTIALVQPFLIPTNYGERPGQTPRCHSLDRPMPTVVGTGSHALVEPFLVNYREGIDRRAHSIDKPLGTQDTSNRFGLVEPVLISMEHSEGQAAEPFLVPTNHGASKDGGRRSYSLDRPMPTVTTVDAWGLIEPYLVRYNNNRPEVAARSLDEPLPTADCNDRYGLVLPGLAGVRLDIRFRMLQPHELAAAMSFPPDYQFCGTREQKVKQIGNAWPRRTGRALCQVLLESRRCR